MKIHLFSFLIFRNPYLSFFLPLPIHGSGLPYPWIFHFEINHNTNKYIIDARLGRGLVFDDETARVDLSSSFGCVTFFYAC